MVPFPCLLHRQNFGGAAPLRGAETVISTYRPRGRNSAGHTKKATPENLLVGSLVLRIQPTGYPLDFGQWGGGRCLAFVLLCSGRDELK